MQDLVALGTGNSRLMKSNISPSTTLSELISMLNNGTFPYDIGPLNAAGISQQGTALNKATLLKDATAALFGLGTDAVPDDVLKVLSQAALYKTVTPTAQLGTLAEGSIIYLNENGQPVPFYVAKQNYEPTYNTDRVLIVRKGAYQQGNWNETNVNTYNGSTIDTWMNGTYLQMLDSDVQSAVSTTNIPATSPYNSGVIRLEKSIFALSGTELGESGSPMNVEGSALPIVSILIRLDESGQFTRSPLNNSTTNFYQFTSNGGLTEGNYQSSNGYVPSFTLPASFEVLLSPVTGLYTVTNDLIMALPSVQIETGSYTGTGTYGSSNPNTLTFGFVPKFVVVGYATNQWLIFITTDAENSDAFYASTDYPNKYTISGNELKWYTIGTNAVYQLNGSGLTYRFIAIG